MKTEKYFKKTNKPKLNIFKLIIIILFLFIFILIPVKAKGKPCTVLLGDFMVTLVNLEREGDIANLEFSVTKVADSNSGYQSLAVYLIDDHENEYKGSLKIDVGGASDFILNTLPKSFTYVGMVSISIPEIAPIDKIRIGNMKEQAFKEIETIAPQFMKELGDFAITKGQSVTVGKWLSFTLKDIIPASRHWDLLIKIENKEYNLLNSSIRVAVQLNDGIISWSRLESEDIPSLSESLLKVTLPISSWFKGGPPQPRVLLLEYNANIPETKKVLKMFSMTLDELPPLVGQGINEDLFVEAYKRNGGRDTMGDPLDIPRWFTGGDKPKDKNDVLIQEFTSVSEFGKSAIIWDKQNDIEKAFVINNNFFTSYKKLGGPYHKLESNDLLGAPLKDVIHTKKGSYCIFEGGAIVPYYSNMLFVVGRIFKRWEKEGFDESWLGLPVSNQENHIISGAKSFITEGLIQKFQRGYICLHDKGLYANQTFIIPQYIAKLYIKLGGINSLLGLPTSEMLKSPHLKFNYMNFEGGIIKYQKFPEAFLFISSEGYYRIGIKKTFDSLDRISRPVKKTIELVGAEVKDKIIKIDINVIFNETKGYSPGKFNEWWDVKWPNYEINRTTAYLLGAKNKGADISYDKKCEQIDSCELFVSGVKMKQLEKDKLYSGCFSFLLPSENAFFELYIDWPSITSGVAGGGFRDTTKILFGLLPYKLNTVTNIKSTSNKEPLETVLMLTSPLKISTFFPPYHVGGKITAEFTIANNGSQAVNLNSVTVGGKDLDDKSFDFPHKKNITMKPLESYHYKESIVLKKPGFYHFFCTYKTPEGNWHKYFRTSQNGCNISENKENILVLENNSTLSALPVTSKNVSLEGEKIGVEVGASRGPSLLKTKDGGYLIVIQTEPNKNKKIDANIIKLDKDKNIEWKKIFGGKEDDWINRAIQTFDEGYALVGTTKSQGTGKADIWVVKLARNGEIMWEKTIGDIKNDRGLNIIQTKDYGYLVCGRSEAQEFRWCTITIILKLDQVGHLKWEKVIEHISMDYSNIKANVLEKTFYNGFLLGVNMSLYPEEAKWGIAKFDYNANLIWEKPFFIADGILIKSFTQTEDEGFLIVGGSVIHGLSNEYRWDGLAVRVNCDGEIKWIKIFGGTEHNYFTDCIQDFDGGFVLCGITRDEKKSHSFVMKLDPNGNLIWKNSLGGKECVELSDIIKESTHGYSYVGSVKPDNDDKSNILMIKIAE